MFLIFNPNKFIKLAMTSSLPKIMAGYAKSGLKCSESLRLGLKVKDPRGCDSVKWHHSKCYGDMGSSGCEVKAIEGFQELKVPDSVDEVIESEIPFSAADIKNNYKGATVPLKWKVFQTIIYLEFDEVLFDSKKVAAFNFDGCLVKPSVQRVGATDWSLMFASIPKKLGSLYSDDYKLVAVDSKIGRLESFLEFMEIHFQVYIACGVNKGQEVDPFRKPQTGMWRIMEQEFNSYIPVDLDQSFYVGRAHSDADKKFAKAIGLKYYRPEEFFDE